MKGKRSRLNKKKTRISFGKDDDTGRGAEQAESEYDVTLGKCLGRRGRQRRQVSSVGRCRQV